ncbi:MAG: hypothetical protein HY921_11335 [Elusimicrobia bacterium]|nr:hypothetical protein [Elusimicrobiota bacterium]
MNKLFVLTRIFLLVLGARLAGAAEAPYYRVFRGVKRPDVTQEYFARQLTTVFIPALPAAHAKNGAAAYLPALPPEGHPASIVDEYALVAYESEPVYQAARRTPEGQAYSDLHWTIFDREKSRSDGAVPLHGTLAEETPYDVTGRPVDWQSGHSTFFIGTRHPNLEPAAFSEKLLRHVQDVEQAFRVYGLDGYVIIVTKDKYEAAFQHWPNPEAAGAAFASAPGQAIIAGAREILVPVQWSVVEPFNGEIRPGQAVNVLFERRSVP